MLLTILLITVSNLETFDEKTAKVNKAVGGAVYEAGSLVTGEAVCKLTGDLGGECEAPGRIEGKVVDSGYLGKDTVEDCCS